MRLHERELEARTAARSAYAVLVLTSIHHAYGAYVYHTPWRLHVVPVALVVGAIIWWARERAARGREGGRLAWWVFVGVTLAMPIVAIGLFEGLYNHVTKNLLFFGGASPDLMRRLFPPPAYEMPSDAFFEITGILQAVPALMAGWHLARAVGPGIRARGADAPLRAPHSSECAPTRDGGWRSRSETARQR